MFTRIRIGHTRLTHQYLLEAETLPQCEICESQSTIKHILVECKKYKYIQKKYYKESDIKKLFGRISPHRILNFLQKINLLESL